MRELIVPPIAGTTGRSRGLRGEGKSQACRGGKQEPLPLPGPD